MTLDMEMTISEKLCLLFFRLGWIPASHSFLHQLHQTIILHKNENYRVSLKMCLPWVQCS